MNMKEIKEVARLRGVKPGKLKKVDLVRGIQQSENNPQCFCTNYAHACGEDDCMWREDCL